MGRRSKVVGTLFGMILMLGLIVAPAGAEHLEQGLEDHCADHNGHDGKVEATGNPASAEETLTIDGEDVTVTIDGINVTFTDGSNEPIVVEFCIKAGDLAGGLTTGTTGMVTWVNHGGQTPDVSYVILYGFPEPVVGGGVLTLELVKIWEGPEQENATATLMVDEEEYDGAFVVEHDDGYTFGENVSGLDDDCGFVASYAIGDPEADGTAFDGTFEYQVDEDDADDDGLITIYVTNLVECQPVLGGGVVINTPSTTTTTTTTTPEETVQVLGVEQVRPSGVPAGTGGHLPATGAQGLLLLLLTGLGLTLGGITLRRMSIE